MSWNRYALPSLLAGIALSTALAQTPSSQPPARTKSSAQGKSRSAGHTSVARTGNLGRREHGNSWRHRSRHPAHNSRDNSGESA